MFRPKLRWLYLYFPLLVVLVALLAGLWGWRQVQQLGRVDVGSSLVPAEGDAVNYLIVGSDTRDGIEADRLEFRWGVRARVQLASRTLDLVM